MRKGFCKWLIERYFYSFLYLLIRGFKYDSFWFKSIILHQFFNFCFDGLLDYGKDFGVGYKHLGGHDGVEIDLRCGEGIVSQTAADDGSEKCAASRFVFIKC